MEMRKGQAPRRNGLRNRQHPAKRREGYEATSPENAPFIHSEKGRRILRLNVPVVPLGHCTLTAAGSASRYDSEAQWCAYDATEILQSKLVRRRVVTKHGSYWNSLRNHQRPVTWLSAASMVSKAGKHSCMNKAAASVWICIEVLVSEFAQILKWRTLWEKVGELICVDWTSRFCCQETFKAPRSVY